MRSTTAHAIPVIAVLAVLLPIGATAAEIPATASPIAVSQATNLSAVRVSGTVPGIRSLQASLYATFESDLPVVLLNRRPLVADADGHFDATISIAPAYFPGTTITVVVQTSEAQFVGRSSVTIVDPNPTR